MGDAPVDCILGTPFLSLVQPHGSCTINNQPGYFITIPTVMGKLPKVIQFPFVSENYWQLGYLHCMVHVKQFNHISGRAETHYYDDNTPWQVFRSSWHPTW